jgi:hypothetical protein
VSNELDGADGEHRPARFTFDAAQAEAAREQAHRVSAELHPENIFPSGVVDPTPVLRSFGCLRVKPSWQLRAYIQWGVLEGESRIVALPEDAPSDELMLTYADLPDSNDRPYARSSFFDERISVPLSASRRFMTAVDGDGTPWSYLCASLAVRELLDFAASWHSRLEHDWHEHRIVGAWPEEFPAEEIRESSYGNVMVIEEGHPRLHFIEECTSEDGGMRVLRVHPPIVWLNGYQLGVRFHTYRPASVCDEGVWVHEDYYDPGSYDPNILRLLAAVGRKKSMFI